MAVIGKIIKKGIELRESLEQSYTNPFDLQKRELLKLLISARETLFGQHNRFSELLKAFRHTNERRFISSFRDHIPIQSYDSIFENWWLKSREGINNVCWPGKVKYFALSSGTSGDSSKYIPVTNDMLRSIKRASVRQLLTLSHYDLPPEAFNKGVLMLGGSTKLKKIRSFYDADLSGITASNIPFWFQQFYKPGRKISRFEDWGSKLDKITEKAWKWDIGFVVGVPAWIQILIEKIVETYHLKNIHEIWPNLNVFVHGGVAMEPYQKSFNRLLGREIKYIETYLASEGFLAFQSRPETNSMKLVLNNGIFYEFIPFNEKNFDQDGNPTSDAETLLIDEVEENADYAILISTCSGAWRYLIGDVVRFTSVKESEIVITGRTKHFLSLCGEHLSVDNMNKAIQMVEDELEIYIKEFTVTGVPEGTRFSHKWFIGCDSSTRDDIICKKLDEKLKMLNDDYRTERDYALKNVYVTKLPVENFYTWMRINGKEGGQNKFPRVIKGQKCLDWENFLKEQLNSLSI
ncbi:MAG: GH3 auxin-responsive promoter family protein [Cytophagales bacterium]|nr:GH3 auxin-responsive promoter family protein [Cytophagales bacterium]